MEIRFALQGSDYQALQRMLARQLARIAYPSPWFGFNYHLLQGLPVGVALAAIIDALQRNQMRPGLACWLLGSALFLYALRFAAHRLLWRRIGNAIAGSGDPLFLEQKLTVSTEGIFTETAGSSGSYAWTSFGIVEEDNERLFLFLGHTRAILIPKSALPGDCDRRYFIEKITSARKSSAFQDAGDTGTPK